ncbi:hypothetical protein HMI55_004536 [Coelomomyces lativittatus]|nr:hypothetical protein HMI55_004536 [Coelomomyces lativittatus]
MKVFKAVFKIVFFLIWLLLLTCSVCGAPTSDHPSKICNTALNVDRSWQTSEFSVSFLISPQNLFDTLTISNILDKAAALLYENALWNHPEWNVTEYVQVINNFGSMTKGSLNLQYIFNTLSSTGTLPLAIFLLFAILFFIISIIQCLVIPCCCLCCCKPRKRGYKRPLIFRTSLCTLFVLGGFIYLSVMTISYSTNLSAALTAIGNTTVSVISAGATFAQKVLDASDSVKLTVNQTPSILVKTFKDLDYNSKLVLPTLGTPYQVLQSDFTLLSTSLNQTIANLYTSSSSIFQFQSDRSNNIQALNGLSQNIQALSTIRINGVNYSTPNPPDSNTVTSSSLPDLSSLPSLTTIQNNLNSIPNLSNSFSQIQDVFLALPNILSTNISSQVNSSLSSTGSLDASLSQTFNNLKNSLEPMKYDFYNMSNSTARIFNDDVKNIDYIRSDTIKIMYFIFIGFCSIGCIGVFVQKGKCMYLVIPFVVILAILFWVQFFVYFSVNLPINEVCRAKDPLLKSNIDISSTTTISPTLILNSCSNHGNVFNVTVLSNKTLVQTLGLSEISHFFDDSQTFLSNTIPFSTLNATLQRSIGNPFPNSNATFQNVEQSLTLPNGFTFSVFQVASPYSLSNLQSNLASFSTALTPSTINPSFSSSAMNTKILNFNTNALSANSSWVPWTYNDFVQHFITNSETFSASTYVTGSASHPSNTQITNSFNTAFQDIQFYYAAMIAISQMQLTIASISSTANQVLSPISNKLNTISTSMTYVETNFTSMNTLVHTKLPQDEADLQQAISTWKSLLPQLIYATLLESIVKLLTTTKNILEQATDCYSISVLAADVIGVLCYTTRDALNGLWFCVWLCGLNVFPALFFMFQAFKRFGNGLRIVPVNDIKDGSIKSKKKKDVKNYGKGSDEEKRALKSEAMLEEESI